MTPTPRKKPDAAARVVAAWSRIEVWLRAGAPAILEALARPASARALASAEKAFGLALPEAMRQLYLLHDGLKNRRGLFEGWSWLPIREVVSQWRDWRELLDENRESWEGPGPGDADRGVRAENWNVGWIPITHDGSGDHHCVDLAPATGGTPGQIIRMWHDSPERELKARSLAEWLETFAARLEAGELVWSEENERIEEAARPARARPARARPATRRAKAAAAASDPKRARTSKGGAESSPPLKWTFVAGGAITSCAAIGSDGTIYCGSADRNLHAIQPDGKVAWTFATDGEVRSSPAIDSDGTIYFGSDDQNLYAVARDGKKKWAFPTDNCVAARPVLGGDGSIYVASSIGTLYAVTARGKKKWQAEAGDCGPAIARDGTLYVAGADEKDSGSKYLHAISPAGKNKWGIPIGHHVASSPVVGSDGTVYVGSFDGKLYAVAPDGQTKWAFQTRDAVGSSPAVGGDGTVYVGSGDEHLYAIAPDGQKRWAFNAGGRVWASPAVGRDGTVYVSCHPRSLFGITAAGKKKWVFAGAGMWSSVAIGGDGTIYVGNTDGKLYAVGDH